MAYDRTMETLADISRLPLPPGSSGLPLLGETLAFVRNSGKFLEEHLTNLCPHPVGDGVAVGVATPGCQFRQETFGRDGGRVGAGDLAQEPQLVVAVDDGEPVPVGAGGCDPGVDAESQ